MTSRPTTDLDPRRERVVRAAREIAESGGWNAVTTRRLAAELGVTQPELSAAFMGRQEVLDAVALAGFGELADALEAVEATPRARMRAYLEVAEGHPRTYEVMFSLSSQLPFGAAGAPEVLLRAFDALRAAFPEADDTRVEVAWAALHGLAALQNHERLPGDRARARFELVHQLLTQPEPR